MSEPEITPETFQPPKPHPLISSLPAWLKRPESFEKVQRALYEAGASSCSHSEVLEWSACVKCQGKQHDRAALMHKMGFKSGAQYLAWRKTHEKIRELYPLDKYNTPK